MTRARVYEGRVRFLDFRNTHHKRLKSGDPIYGAVRDIKLRTLMPVMPQGEVFPVVRNIGANPAYLVGEPPKPADAEMAKRKNKPLAAAGEGWILQPAPWKLCAMAMSIFRPEQRRGG